MRLDLASELGARVEVEVMATRQDAQDRAGHRTREPLAGGHAARAIAVRREQGRRERRELGVAEIGLAANIGEQTRVQREELDRRDEPRRVPPATGDRSAGSTNRPMRSSISMTCFSKPKRVASSLTSGTSGLSLPRQRRMTPRPAFGLANSAAISTR